MRRDWERVSIYAGRKTVWQVFSEDVPMGSINPETGHEIVVKIIRRGKMLCKDYGEITANDFRFDDMPVKKMVRRPDEIRTYV